MMLRAGGVALIVSFVGSFGCSSDIDIGQNVGEARPAGSGSGGTAGNGGMGGSGVSGTGGCEVTSCQGRVYECGNCVDDDVDGTTDSDDVHCTGPCDHSEASFAIDIREGMSPPCKRDCFFDGDVGSGNDGCNYSDRCDSESAPPDYPPSGDAACAYDDEAPIPGMSLTCAEARVAQDPMCGEVCGPLVPNGCDCFGCCELPAGSNEWVSLGSESAGAGTCTMDTLGVRAACRPCTPVQSCLNQCDPCDICVGRTAPDPSCAGGVPTCPTGMAACGVDGERCGAGFYCITGCCVPEPVVR
jgi:hypothetical protein